MDERSNFPFSPPQFCCGCGCNRVASELLVELGYALGNGQRVILTAMDGTDFPFDVFAIEHFPWKEGEEISAQLDRFRTHWERNIDMPKLVCPNEAR
jgi:hypothetical protein